MTYRSTAGPHRGSGSLSGSGCHCITGLTRSPSHRGTPATAGPRAAGRGPRAAGRRRRPGPSGVTAAATPGLERDRATVSLTVRLPGLQAATGSHGPGRGQAPQARGLFCHAALAVGPARVTPRSVPRSGTHRPTDSDPRRDSGSEGQPAVPVRHPSSEPRPGPSPLRHHWRGATA